MRDISIEQQRHLRELHNSRLPVCSTPTEILSEILDIAVHADNCFYTTSRPDIFASVCRRFRDVAIGSSRLWTSVTFSSCYIEGPYHWEADALYLSRSRSAPLDVCIEWDRRSLDEKEGRVARPVDFSDLDYDSPGQEFHWLTTSDVDRAVKLLLPHVGRIRTFSVECEVYFPFHMLISSFSNIPAPSLEWLELSCTKPYLEAWHFQPAKFATPVKLFNGEMPLLRDVSLTGVHVDWQATKFSELRRLSLAHHALEVRPTMAMFRSILTSSPSLAKLDLIGSSMQLTEADMAANPLPLSALTSLSLRWACVELLHALIGFKPMRQLKQLNIADCMGRTSSSMLAIIGTMFPNIVDLELERVFGVPECQIIDTLARLPLIEKLSMDHAGSARALMEIIISRDAKRPANTDPLLPKLRELHIMNGSDAESKNVRQYLQHRANMQCKPLERCSVVEPDFDGDGEDMRILLAGSGEELARVPWDPSDMHWQFHWDDLVTEAASAPKVSSGPRFPMRGSPPSSVGSSEADEDDDSLSDSGISSGSSLSSEQTEVDDEPPHKDIQILMSPFHDTLLSTFTSTS